MRCFIKVVFYIGNPNYLRFYFFVQTTLEDATRIAFRELIRRMVKEYSYDQWDTYMMLSQCAKVRLGNFVDPKYTVGAAIAREYLD